MSDRRKTIVVVEDTNQGPAMPLLISEYFPEPRYEVAIVGDFLEAARVLCDPTRRVVGCAIDNGFRMTPDSARVGATRGNPTPTTDQTEYYNLRKQGSAGLMLLRFLRSGTHGAVAASTLDILQHLPGESNPDAPETFGQKLDIWLGSDKAVHLQELQQVPVIWNSADPKKGKIAQVQAVVEGKEIVEADKQFWDEKIDMKDKEVRKVNDLTYVAGKYYREMFDTLAGIIRKRSLHEPLAFELCNEHGMEPKPEMEFSLAVQYRRMDIIRDIHDRYRADISGERIASAIGMIASAPNILGFRIMDYITNKENFPRADVNAYHVIPMSEPPRVWTALYEAVMLNADSIVSRLLKIKGIVIHGDVVELAEQSPNKHIRTAFSAIPKQNIFTDEKAMRSKSELTNVYGYGLEVRAPRSTKKNVE